MLQSMSRDVPSAGVHLRVSELVLCRHVIAECVVELVHQEPLEHDDADDRRNSG